MNTMKILIGATFALLLVGLVLSYQNMREKEHANPADAEIARLEKRIAQLEAADSGVYPQNGYDPKSLQPKPTPNPLEQQAADQAKQLEIERLKKELAEQKAKSGKEIDEAKKKADMANREAGALAGNDIDRRKPETARANRIVQALLMARVSLWDEENLLLALKIERPENVPPGTILAIRRNSGIIGRVKVAKVELNEGVADPIPGSFMGGKIDIQEGDELIIPPAF